MLRCSSATSAVSGWSGERSSGVPLAPAPYELRGQQFLAAGIDPGGVGELPSEGCDVLAQLAVDEVRAVRAQLGRRRCGRQHALLVGVTEYELPRLDRSPAAVLRERALPGSSGTPLPSIDGCANPSA